MIAVDITSVEGAVESWSVEPEKLALRGRSLGQGIKGIDRSKQDYGQSKFLANRFGENAFRGHEHDHAVGDVLQDFVAGDVSVGGSAQRNLRDEKHEEEQGGRVQRVLGQLHLPEGPLLSSPGEE